MKALKSLSLYPFLFILYAALAPLASNLDQIPPSLAVRPLAVLLVAAAAGMLLLYAVFRDWQYAAYLVFLVFAFFFTFGHLSRLAQDRLTFLDEPRRELLMNQVTSSYYYFLGFSGWLPRLAGYAGFQAGPPDSFLTKEIRQMLFTLRPLVLESQGLVAALHHLAAKLRETHQQEVLVDVDPCAMQDLEIGRQGVVFYIVEEAVNNARKHAMAPHIWVRIKREQDVALLEVEDDGIGFDVGEVEATYDQRGSLGMVNLRDRSELVDGVLRITSEKGRGTRVSVSIPLSEEAAERLHRPGLMSS